MIQKFHKKISAFLNDLNIPKLSEEQQKQCEGSISSEECFCVLNSFDLNKTPGNDGIPIEFYKTFWAALKDSFIKCVNECFEKGEMSNSQKQADITLIKKKGKIARFLKIGAPSLL